jgi:hypothetical protein
VNGGVGVDDVLYSRGSTGDFGIGFYDPTTGGYDPTGAFHYFTQAGTEYIALDGSGYIYDQSGGIWDKSGNHWTDADNAAGGMTYTVTDPDGMQVQSVGTPYLFGDGYERVTTVYTDSLGATFLTSDEPLYGGAPPSKYTQPNTYSYVDASGATQTLTVNYSLYSMQANFTCFGSSGGASNPYAPLPSSVVLPTGGKIGFTYEATPGFPSGDVTGRIAAITLPSGGSITYTYGGSNNGINCTDWFSSVPTLTRTVNDGAGHTATWTYVTTGFTTSLCSVNCYSTTTVTDPLGNDTVYTFFLECGIIDNTFFCKTPIQTQKLEYQGHSSSNNVLRATTSTYPYNTNCVVWVCGIIQYTTQAPITQNSGIVSGSATETLYDPAGSGNVVNTQDFDFGVNFPAPSGSALSDTVTTYGSWNGTSCVPLSNHLSDRPCSTITTGPSGSVVSAVYNTYNATGDATTTSTWVSGSGVSAKYLTSTASYYSNGTVKSSTDVNGGITSYTGRLCNGVFPGVTSLPAVNGVTLSTSQTWNCTGGVITSYTDSNGNPTNFGYINPVSGKADPLWRQTQVSYPDGGSSTTTYNTGITTPWTVSTTRAINGTQNWSSVAQYDGLGACA